MQEEGKSIAEMTHLFIEFGPYAVLAVAFVFALLFTRQAQAKAQERRRYNAAHISMGVSWMIAVTMVIYVVMNWPPMQVRLIPLGQHVLGARFVSSDERVYINSEAAAAGERNTWRLAIVRRLAHGEARRVEFTYIFPWTDLTTGEKKSKFADYRLSEEQLASIRELQPDLNSPGSLLYDHDGNMDTPWVPLPPINFVATTGAETRPDYFLIPSANAADIALPATEPAAAEEIAQLSNSIQSNDPVQQAAARKILRSTPAEQLEALSKQLEGEAGEEIEEYLVARQSQQAVQVQLAPSSSISPMQPVPGTPPSLQSVWLTHYDAVLRIPDERKRRLLETALMLGAKGMPYRWGGRTIASGLDSAGFFGWTLRESEMISPGQQAHFSIHALKPIMSQTATPGETAVVEVYEQGIVAFIMPDGTRYAFLPDGPAFFDPPAGTRVLGYLSTAQLEEITTVVPK